MNVHLSFHGVGICIREHEPAEAMRWVSHELFLRILDDVVDRDDVSLSFDEGNRTDVEVALPALRERGLTAIFFPLAGRLDDPLCVSPSDLHVLRDAGMSIGNLGWNHTPWRRLSAGAAHREFVTSRQVLEVASGMPITTAALPMGRYDRRTLHGLRHEGYRTVYTSDRYPTRDRAWLSARYTVDARDTLDSVRQVIHGHPGLREARHALSASLNRII